jgi:hypothetical protein
MTPTNAEIEQVLKAFPNYKTPGADRIVRSLPAGMSSSRRGPLQHQRTSLETTCNDTARMEGSYYNRCL